MAVTIAERIHLFPYRTQKLSSLAPKVLGLTAREDRLLPPSIHGNGLHFEVRFFFLYYQVDSSTVSSRNLGICIFHKVSAFYVLLLLLRFIACRRFCILRLSMDIGSCIICLSKVAKVKEDANAVFLIGAKRFS